jgi:hypothetical protein
VKMELGGGFYRHPSVDVRDLAPQGASIEINRTSNCHFIPPASTMARLRMRHRAFAYCTPALSKRNGRMARIPGFSA